jgi:hypothetical protein
MNEDQCSKVFVKKGDKISFAQFSEEFGGALSRMEMTSEAKPPDTPSRRGKKPAIPSIFKPHVHRK